MAIVKRLPESTNNSKAFMQKIIITALTLIIGLVAAVWAITWDASEGRMDKADLVTNKNTEAINEIKIFIAQQVLINKNQEKFFGDQHEMMLKVLEEVKKK